MLDTNGSATACASIMLSRWTEYDYVEIICDGEAIATVHREGSPSNAIVVPRVWPVLCRSILNFFASPDEESAAPSWLRRFSFGGHPGVTCARWRVASSGAARGV